MIHRHIHYVVDSASYYYMRVVYVERRDRTYTRCTWWVVLFSLFSSCVCHQDAIGHESSSSSSYNKQFLFSFFFVSRFVSTKNTQKWRHGSSPFYFIPLVGFIYFLKFNFGDRHHHSGRLLIVSLQDTHFRVAWSLQPNKTETNII